MSDEKWLGGSCLPLNHESELKRLNEFCVGKQVARITYNASGMDWLTLLFMDGSSADISTLGGAEIEALKEAP